MKRLFACILALLLMASMLSGCGLDLKSESEPYFEDMMEALSDGDTDEAMELLHPDVAEDEDAEAGVQSLIDLLDGREMEDYKRTGVNIYSGVNTEGKTKQESCTYEVELEDGTELSVEFEYVTNRDGEGFAVFKMTLSD